MIIKVCGMREADNIRAVEQTGADWIGFIFYNRSPRFVSSLPAYLPSLQKRAGVFVNASVEEIIGTARLFKLDIVQLHGDETPEVCRAIKAEGLTTVRAVSVGNENDVAAAARFEAADYLLFDTQTATRGGSGKRFDWQLLEAYDGKTPFLLSGGINETALGDITAFKHKYFAGIDLNSGFEISPALKNATALSRFIKAVRHAEQTRRAAETTSSH